MVGGTETLELRIDLDKHGLVGAETAGCNHDSLSVDGAKFTSFIFVLNAGNFAVFYEELLNVGANVNVFVLRGFSKCSNHVSTDEATACRTVSAFVGGTGHHTDVSEVSA